MVEPELFGHSQRSLWQTFLLWPSLTEGCLLGAHFMRDPRSDAGNCSHGWLVVSSGNKLQVTARSIPPRENWMLQEPTSEFETTSHRWAVAAANITRDRLPLGSWWPSGDQQKPAQQSKCSCAKPVLVIANWMFSMHTWSLTHPVSIYRESGLGMTGHGSLKRESPRNTKSVIPPIQINSLSSLR